MTTSTDNNSEETPKKKKAKGPIRFEAIIPVTIIVALMVAYFTFFFDHNLRKGLEWTGTYVHGAEVNIASIKTSFINGSFALNGLQVTDKETPERNLVQIGSIRFGFLWDALLRAKFVVNEATIENIQAWAPRKKPGYVVPPDKQEGTALKKAENEVINQTKEEFDQNILGDVASVMGGTSEGDQLKNIQGSLKAETRMKEINEELKKKEKEWNERLAKLPKGKELQDIANRAKKATINTKDPIKAAKDIQNIQKIIKEADQKIKQFQEAERALKTDIKSVDNSYKEIDQLINQDLKDLQNRLKIPDINVGDFSTKLFGRMIQDKVAGVRKYMEVGRQYMPPKKSAEEKQPEIVPPKRGEGKNIRFPVTTGYPLFWLKYGKISSEPNESEYSGKIKGEIKDVCSDPVYLQRPAIITLAGEFPKQKIFGLDAKVVIDHTTDQPKETLEATVGSFPTGGQQLSSSSDVQFAINQAQGSSKINGILQNQTVKLNVRNSFKQIQYDLKAKNKVVDDILRGVVNGIPVVTLDADITGSWSSLNFGIRSNLGQELSKGFKKQVQAQIDAAKKKLKAQIDEKISGERAKLQAQIDKVKNQIDGALNKKKKEIDGVKKSAQGQLDSKKKAAGNSQKKKLEKEGKKLLKKFGL